MALNLFMLQTGLARSSDVLGLAGLAGLAAAAHICDTQLEITRSKHRTRGCGTSGSDKKDDKKDSQRPLSLEEFLRLAKRVAVEAGLPMSLTSVQTAERL